MKLNRYLGAYFLGVLSMSACASFSWRYYATSMPDACYDQGTLLGNNGAGGWPDLSLSTCKPDPMPSPGASPGAAPVLLKCITLLVDDFYSLKADDEKCHADLDACQAGPAPQVGASPK